MYILQNRTPSMLLPTFFVGMEHFSIPQNLSFLIKKKINFKIIAKATYLKCRTVAIFVALFAEAFAQSKNIDESKVFLKYTFQTKYMYVWRELFLF